METKMISAAIVAIFISFIVWKLFMSSNPESLPPLENEWWGPLELKTKQDTSIKPFQIKFTDEMITDLRSRLTNHRPFTPPLEGVGFTYGFNSNELSPWVSYWANKYPFAERERFLNQFPQYKTNIQGLDIHFIRVKPENVKTAVPILLIHGWPGSVREFYEAIPLLTKPAPGYDFAFEVIVPSIPGYGFSDAAVRPSLGPSQIGLIFKNLMERLGHKKFYIQGGDWGAVIAAAMSTYFPEDILGHHTNLPFVSSARSYLMTLIGAYFPSLVVEPHLASRMYPLSKFFAFMLEEFGYFHLQATKPDTVGVGLSDSPAGLLAYILEKFSTWTDVENRSLQDGGLSTCFSKDQLIDNLMFYWTPNSITSSMRLYAENVTNKNRKINLNKYPSPVPTWVLQAKCEILYQPLHFMKHKYPNLLGGTVLDKGGHFFAFELPQDYADDVFKAVKVFRNWHDNKV